MIQFILFVNQAFQIHFARYYGPFKQKPKEAQAKEEQSIIQACLNKYAPKKTSFKEFNDLVLVHRSYEHYTIIMGIDEDENEFAILEFIHLLMEIIQAHLDETDDFTILSNIEKVHLIVDEMIMEGQIYETCMAQVLSNITVGNSF